MCVLSPECLGGCINTPFAMVFNRTIYMDREHLSVLHEHLIMLTSAFHQTFFSFKVYANWVEILSSILEAILKNLSTPCSEQSENSMNSSSVVCRAADLGTGLSCSEFFKLIA